MCAVSRPLDSGFRRNDRRYAPCALRSIDHSEDVAPMNRRCRSDMPKEQFAATSGVRILPIMLPSGLKTWMPSPAET